MDSEIKNLQSSIQKFCPQGVEVSIVPTMRRLYLVVIKYPPQVDIDDWALSLVNFHWNIIIPLFRNSVLNGKLRSLYCCDNEFVFYCPDLSGYVLRKFGAPIVYESYGYGETHKYIGNCKNIDDLISFLTQTLHLIF